MKTRVEEQYVNVIGSEKEETKQLKQGEREKKMRETE